MHKSLKRLQAEQNLDGDGLRMTWHELMEDKDHRHYREEFFSAAVNRANEASRSMLVYFLGTNSLLTVTKCCYEAGS